MCAKYLFRIDDVCPTMDWDNFMALCKLFEEYNVKPILGVIPDNQDPKLKKHDSHPDFWDTIRRFSQKGWIIAQHGYQHLYVTKNGGLLNINQQSEFAGLPLTEQKRKIQAGQSLLQQKLGIPITWWMAPSHSFDIHTCQALRELGFTHITDGLALYPFQKYGLCWIPQQLWQPKPRLLGVWTICIHPDTTTPDYIQRIHTFLEQQKDNRVTEADFTPRSNLLSSLYTPWWKFQYAIYKMFWKK